MSFITEKELEKLTMFLVKDWDQKITRFEDWDDLFDHEKESLIRDLKGILENAGIGVAHETSLFGVSKEAIANV